MGLQVNIFVARWDSEWAAVGFGSGIEIWEIWGRDLVQTQVSTIAWLQIGVSGGLEHDQGRTWDEWKVHMARMKHRRLWIARGYRGCYYITMKGHRVGDRLSQTTVRGKEGNSEYDVYAEADYWIMTGRWYWAIVVTTYRASRSDSRRESMSLFRTAPLTLRMIDRDESSMNSTRHWVTLPRDPVRPRTRTTRATWVLFDESYMSGPE
jgi:hypothetical protein